MSSWGTALNGGRRASGYTPGVGLLAVGLDFDADLPHPAFPLVHQRSVVAALFVAWSRLVRECEVAGLAVVDLSEPELTMLLERILNRMLHVPDAECPGFSARWLQYVSRDASQVSHDGTCLEKRPDLTFRLSHMPATAPHGLDRAWFAECKLIDDAQSIHRYCNDGIRRFVRGEYAWAMSSGVMLGYLRQLDRPDQRLLAYLDHPRAGVGTELDVTRLPQRSLELSDTGHGEVWMSTHGRRWRYATGGAPGPIDLQHVWLATPPSTALPDLVARDDDLPRNLREDLI